MKRKRDIEMWMLLVIVLLTACSDHSGEGSDEKDDCFLNIYVYAPGHPMLTRADVGEIAHREIAESTVHTLQIWVFKHSNGDLVGYLNATPSFLNETDGQELFRMKVEKEFADHPENVDVYVVANAGSCGLATGDNSLKERTKREELDAAMIGEGYFGVNTLVSESYMQTAGLPMSGVEKDQPIYGSFPALRIGSQEKMTTVQLTRAVSKLRFVLCRKTEVPATTKKILESIDEITLNPQLIPAESYLMPKSTPYPSSLFTSSPGISYGSVAKDQIPQVANPMVYAYETQQAQEYENLINHAADEESSRKEANLTWLKEYGSANGITAWDALTTNDLPQLKELGLTYLRESDKQLTGVIRYTVKERESLDTSWENENVSAKEEIAEFSMAAEGDFLRNHSWIIYIFFVDGKIHVLTVTHIGMKAWGNGGTGTHEVYNW